MMSENQEIGYTYSLLGLNGQLGDQLWHIAGTIGLALENGKLPLFPRWDYEECFSIPYHYFTPFLPPNLFDLAPGSLQDHRIWADLDDTIREVFRPSDFAREIVDGALKDFDTSRCAATIMPLDGLSDFDLEKIEEVYNRIDHLFIFNRSTDFHDNPFADKMIYIEDINPIMMENDETVERNPIALSLDLFFMTRMRYHLMSSNSFSWWGFFLADNAEACPIGEKPSRGPRAVVPGLKAKINS